jgi:hypothetical protein
MASCSICTADNQEELEELGRQALAGSLSWREAARQGGIKYAVPLTAHMEKHYVDPLASHAEANESTYEALLQQAVTELQGEMAFAAPDVKALYAVAIANLIGLKDTKPSQQHLINALKAIQEVTGMKAENRHLLDYSRHITLDAAEDPEIEDAEVVPLRAIEAT